MRNSSLHFGTASKDALARQSQPSVSSGPARGAKGAKACKRCGAPVRRVEHEHAAVRAAEEGRPQALEALLPRGVPDLRAAFR